MSQGFFLMFKNPLAFASGSIWDLQNIIMSQRPSRVVFIAGGRGGVDSGEMVPIGRESCRVGGTVATKMRVICSGVTAVASLASPFAAWAQAEWAFARSEKMSAIRLHTSEAVCQSSPQECVPILELSSVPPRLLVEGCWDLAVSSSV